MPSRKAMWGLLAGLGFLAGVVAACGGSSSSSTGPTSIGGGSGSSGAVVQGQIVNRRADNGESVMYVVFRTALGIGLAEAQEGTPVGGVQVTISRLDDGATFTGTTDLSGQFTIENVVPGTYQVVSVVNPLDPTTPLIINAPDTFTVGAGDGANIILTVTEGAASDTVNVAALETDPSAVFQNDAQAAHALQIAKAAGLVSATPVTDLRLAGWGWGRIAKHFGVHPSVIGLGNNGLSPDEIATFKASNGQGKGKGNGNSKGKKKGQA